MDDPKRNSRSANGRFLPGNKAGKGNPLNKKAHQLRNALLSTVTQADLVAVTKKLVAMARKGDLHAIKELLDRCLGRPTASVEITQAEAVERLEEMSDAELMAIATGAEGSGE
jgi:hypothetical protein